MSSVSVSTPKADGGGHGSRARGRPIGLLGVPSSAGAHGPGQEKAPAVLRRAGLIDQLRATGWEVVDHGDLPRVRCHLDPAQRRLQNLGPVVAVAHRVAARVAGMLQAQHLPVVLGGDCTITLGVVSGFLRQGAEVALLYMDGGLDLALPGRYRPGILDSMGLAHVLCEPGTAEELRGLGPRVPLLPGTQIVGFGYTPGEPQAEERALLERHGLRGYPVEEVQRQPVAAAQAARAAVEGKAARFVVHFDVDVIDFVDFAVADVPQYNQGLSLQEALLSLREFAASPCFAGLVITEFNPDHVDEEGVRAAAFVEGLAQVLRPPGR